MLKLGFRLSIGIQHRVFVIPWVKRRSASRTLCSEQGDYSSSGITRYVPKKSRKNLTSQSVDASEKGRRLGHSVLGTQLKRNGKEAGEGTYMDLQEKNYPESCMNESFDDSDEVIMSLEESINVSRRDHSVLGSEVKSSRKETEECTFLHLQDNNIVSCDDSRQEFEKSSNHRGYKLMRQDKQAFGETKLHMEVEQAKSSKEACKITQETESMAIRYLGLRAYSAAELKNKLIGKKYPLEIVDRVINDFQIRGYINDSLYAESFTQSRWSSSSWGPGRIKQALFKKGISNKDSETAIKLVFEKSQCMEEDEEAERKHGLSKDVVDQLYVQASKRWLQGRDLPIETRKARVIRWLQYRGFNWGVVSQLLRRLESTHES